MGGVSHARVGQQSAGTATRSLCTTLSGDFHVLALDGVYAADDDDRPQFHPSLCLRHLSSHRRGIPRAAFQGSSRNELDRASVRTRGRFDVRRIRNAVQSAVRPRSPVEHEGHRVRWNVSGCNGSDASNGQDEDRAVLSNPFTISR
jgi:hypothetical protein